MRTLIPFILLLFSACTWQAQAPTAIEDEVFTFDNETATGNLATNDLNPSGLPLTYTLLSNINYGELIVQTNGNWTFVPGPTTSALNDILYYQVCNTLGQCSVGTIQLYVQFHNNIPEANNDVFYVEMNTSITGNVGTNDYDADYLTDPISTQNNFTATSLPSAGTLNLQLNGTFTYTPPPGFLGSVGFNYLNCDACTTCDNATVTIQVVPANANPIANATTINATEDTNFNGSLTSVTSDPENDPLTYSIDQQALNGTVVILANGGYTYAPYNNFFGTDSFTYRVCDNLNQCASAVVTVNVANTNDAPNLTNDSFTLNEDQSTFNGSAAGNDTDDFSTISYSVSIPPSHGILVINANGTFTYLPNSNYNGLDNAIIQGCDAQGLCSSSTLSLSILSVNDPPIAVFDDLFGYEDMPLNGTVANDTDADNDLLSYLLLTPTSSGTISMNENGSFTFMPNSNFAGIVNATYQVCDPHGACVMGNLQIEIIEINDDPIIVSDVIAGLEDQVITGNIRSNDIEPDQEAINYYTTNSPAHGTLILNGNGTFTYTPNANWSGTEVINYFGCDPCAVCLPGTLTIQVDATNDSPVASNGSISTNEDIVFSGTLAGLVSDIDNTSFTYSIAAPANFGVVNIQPSGSYSYAPLANYFGSDSFTYQACDGGGLCSIGIVTVTVAGINDPPIAVADNVSGNEDLPISGTVANDTDLEGQPLTYSLVTSPSNGALILENNGSFSWIPQINFSGTTQVTYTVCDNAGGCANGVLTLTTVPVNDAPVANDDMEAAYQNASATGSIADNDFDIDSQILNYFTTTPAMNGSFLLASNGTFTYTPNVNFSGNDQATYSVCDSNGSCDIGIVQWTVFPTNTAPIANDVAIDSQEDIPVSFNLSELVSDLEGGSLSYELITNSFQASASTVSNGGLFNVIPNTNAFGVFTFAYGVCDSGNLCDTATVTATILPVNDAPVLTNTSYAYSILEDDSLEVNIIAEDAEDDAIGYSLLNASAGMAIDSNGNLTVFAGANQFGVWTAHIEACDVLGACSTSPLSVSVQPVNDLPVAMNDSFISSEDVNIQGVVSDNDSDQEDATLNYTLLSETQHGVISMSLNGAFMYVPETNYYGPDMFSYIVCDGNNACDTANVNLLLNEVNDTPVLQNDSLAINEDMSGELFLGGNDTDLDGDVVYYSANSISPLGEYNLSSNGLFTWLPFPNSFGTDTIEITACDPSGSCNNSSLFIQINAVNDAPLALPDTFTTSEDVAFQGTVLDNDMDVDDAALFVEFLSSPALGSLMDNQQGWFSYTPNAYAFGTESLTYRICDASNSCDTANVLIYIQPVNNPPYVAGEYVHVMEDTMGEGSVAINDQDPDQEELSYALLSSTQHGSIFVDSIGQYVYTPDVNYFGQDSAQYEACDAAGICLQAWIIFEVDFINDAPIVLDEAVQVFMNDSITGTVATNDIELDAEPLTYYVLEDLTFGIFYMAPDGSYTFTPYPDVTGTFTVTYYGCDPCAICDQGTLTILVVTDKDANTAPMAQSVATSICEGDYIQIPMDESVSDLQTPDTNLSFTFGEVSNGLISFDENTHILTYQSMPGVTGFVDIPYQVCDDGLVTLCAEDTLHIALNNHIALHLQEAEIQEPSCFGNADGSIVINLVNVSGNLTFQWSTGGQTNGISNLVAGNYALTIQSDLTCAIGLDTLFVLSEPQLLSITDFTIAGISATGNGTIAPVITGGTAPYAFQWTWPNGTTSAQAELTELTEAGDYILNITDQQGCTTTSSATITWSNELDDAPLLVYWSPTQSSLILHGYMHGDPWIRLFNTVGELCWEERINGKSMFNLDALSAGMYHWQISSASNTNSGQFIKP